MKTKNIIKEIIIVLLLILAIILILGILLYEYVPNNKIIPQQVSYTTPENVKEELSTSENVDDSQVIMTYEVTATDLTNYKKQKIMYLERKIHLNQLKAKILLQKIRQVEIQ